MRINKLIFISENNESRINKDFASAIAVYLRLKAQDHTRLGVIPMNNRSDVAKRIGLHQVTFVKALSLLKSIGLIEDTTSNGKYAVRLRNQKYAILKEYNEKNISKYEIKIKASTIEKQSFDETLLLVYSIALDTLTSQQQFKAEKTADHAYRTSDDNVKSYKDAKIRQRGLKYRNRNGGTAENSVKKVTDEKLAAIWGVSRKTANRIKHKLFKSGMHYFVTIQEVVADEGGKKALKYLKDVSDENKGAFIAGGKIIKNLGSFNQRVFDYNKRFNFGTTIKRVRINTAINIIIGLNNDVFKLKDKYITNISYINNKSNNSNTNNRINKTAKKNK